MDFADFSPPASPSLDQQADALQKGLGRALQWAVPQGLDDEPLLAAYLRNQCYDAQVEGARGEWLWKMVQAVDAVGRFRQPILHAMYDLVDVWTASQVCKLARGYAESGDKPFLKRLYEIVEQKPVVRCPWLGEQEFIHEHAFQFAARIRGKQLASREWDWDDGSLVDYAIERCGEGRVESFLQDSTDEAIQAFREGWLQYKKRRELSRNDSSPSATGCGESP